MYKTDGRIRKARTIVAVLQDFFNHKDLSSLTLLDIGASTGIIDNFLADYFFKVTGIDIDKEALDSACQIFKKDNLEFMVADAMNLDFQDNSFDVIICTHIYEHVPDATKLLKEIHRVLKPQGICYFAAGNRISLIEPHYKLPLLSIIPRPFAHLYMKLSGKGCYYHEKHLTLPGLKKLIRMYTVYDYTPKIIKKPSRFQADYMLKPGSIKHRIAIFIINKAYWLCPTYIWILEKPAYS